MWGEQNGMKCSCSNEQALRCQRQIASIKQQINSRLLVLVKLVGAKSVGAGCTPGGCEVNFQGRTRRGPNQQVARLKRQVIALLRKLNKIVGANFGGIGCNRKKCGEYVFNDRI